MFLNTKQATADDEEFAQTTFYYDSPGDKSSTVPSFDFDLGGRVPSCEDELFAPFYPDPSQRVLAVVFFGCIIVAKIEALLKLARERKGEHLQWAEWQTHVTKVRRDGYTSRLWVSGPRLCCAELTGSGETSIDVYDFGARACAECRESFEDGVAERFAPSVTKIMPWEVDEIITSSGSHNGFSFVLVKIPCS